MIRIDNLTKYYGSFLALDSINFQVENGEILGFLGPNGAGKTTTMQIMTSFLAPSEGNIYVDDLNVIDDSYEIREHLGYLPEHNPLYEDMTVFDFLKFVAKVREIEPASIKRRIDEVVEICGLQKVVHREIGVLSKGYKQRVGLGQAIIHDPRILILDEPTSGLDPNQIAEIRELIKTLGKKKTVLISSHILQEIQATADRMVIINEGKIAADGTLDELMAKFRGDTILEMELKDADTTKLEDIPTINDKIKVVDLKESEDQFNLVLEYPNTIDPREDIFEYAVNNKWKILEMSRSKTSLEDVFRKLTVEQGGSHEN
ncbi:MAG: ATP-binding cassette domain-containing protein [Candidatus Marinimicrobia bacterium]|nr:ATP-binding cassette domain-containing protein [Candidatus Neomarinimicrobiota bacterium]